MKAEARRALFSFLIELLVYSVLVTGLIVVQAVLLEWVTTLLLRLIRGRSE